MGRNGHSNVNDFLMEPALSDNACSFLSLQHMANLRQLECITEIMGQTINGKLQQICWSLCHGFKWQGCSRKCCLLAGAAEKRIQIMHLLEILSQFCVTWIEKFILQ